MKRSTNLVRSILLCALVALALAYLQTIAHDETQRDLAQLTPAQKSEVVGRWRQP